MNTTDLLVSIITPVYNAGTYLSPMIQSVLAQSYRNIELILVDDGSKDGSGEICDRYAMEDGRIIPVHQQNSGQSSARNHGLEIARGEFITFADHDDILHPGMVETLANALTQTQMDVAACQFQHASDLELTQLRFDPLIELGYPVPQGDLIHRFFQPDWHIPIWNKLYRRNVLDGIHFHSAMLGEDNLFSYRVLKKTPSIFFCPTPLYFQRIHENNFEFTGIRYMADLVRTKQTILRDIRASFPREYPAAQAKFLYECIRINNLFLDSGHPELEPERQQVIEMLFGNMDGIARAKMPTAHKLRLTAMKMFPIRKNLSKIIL